MLVIVSAHTWRNKNLDVLLASCVTSVLTVTREHHFCVFTVAVDVKLCDYYVVVLVLFVSKL